MVTRQPTDESVSTDIVTRAARMNFDAFGVILAGFDDFIATRVDAVAVEQESAHHAVTRIVQTGQRLAYNADRTAAQRRETLIMMRMGVNQIDPYYGCERQRSGALDG